MAAPAGERVKLLPLQILPLLTLMIGKGFTETVRKAVLLQPVVELRPRMEYVVVTVGDTLIELVLAPVLQVNVTTGSLQVAVCTAVEPEHKAVVPLSVITGIGSTITDKVEVFTHPLA